MEVQRGLQAIHVHGTHTHALFYCAKKKNSLQYFYFCLHSNKSPANQIINTLGLNRVPLPKNNPHIGVLAPQKVTSFGDKADADVIIKMSSLGWALLQCD